MKRTGVAIGAMFLGASSAIAQPPVVVSVEALPFQVVSFADLNIGSKAGQDRLVHRIRAAAEDVCLENNKEVVKIVAARKECYLMALTNGYRQMNSAIAGYAYGAPLAAATLTISGQ